MYKLRKSHERFRTQISWLNSYHSFSFGEHWHEEHESFGFLRVINEDFVAQGQGFATHGHRDMEIVTYVVQGALAHKDSLGNESTILPGQSQMMSAGTGIRHSEYNPLPNEPSHFLQIWIVPDKKSLNPRYDQKTFCSQDSHSQWVLIASRHGSDTAVSINQDMQIYAVKTATTPGVQTLAQCENKKIWIQNVMHRPSLDLEISGNKVTLESGDGCAIENESDLKIVWTQGAEFLVFVQ